MYILLIKVKNISLIIKKMCKEQNQIDDDSIDWNEIINRTLNDGKLYALLITMRLLISFYDV